MKTDGHRAERSHYWNADYRAMAAALVAAGYPASKVIDEAVRLADDMDAKRRELGAL